MVIKTTNKNYVDLVQKMYMAFNSRDMDEWTKYFDEDTLDYVPSLKEPLKGRKTIRENNEEFIKGIPDVSFEEHPVFFCQTDCS